MKRLLYILVIAGSLSHAADPDKKIIGVRDPKLGKFEITLTVVGEPVQQPLRMDVSALCTDHRTQPNSVAPKTEELLDGDSICAFNKHSFDQKSKVLTIEFTLANNENGKCDDPYKQSFDLKEICAPWNR